MTTINGEAILSVRDLSFIYEQSVLDGESTETIFKDLSLNISEGEILCILGASGCGKSTLLNLIAGLLKPRSGQIHLSKKYGEGSIGYIFQQDALFPWRTVNDNLMLANELRKGVSRQDYILRLQGYLKAFNLQDRILNQYPDELSGGMRQRVSIIQSLMFNPQLLLLDEPFSALDFYTKLCLESEFHQLVKGQRKAAILVTHDIEEAIALGDRVVIMRKGGGFSHEFAINFGTSARSLEELRGTSEFAEYYSAIWSKLKEVLTV